MTLVLQSELGELVIPEWVNDLDSFRKWRSSDEVPEKLKVHFFQGKVWLDTSMEEAFSHNLVKTEITSTLHQIAKVDQSGLVFSDGMLLSNPAAGLSTEPDAMYVSFESIEAGRVNFSSEKRGGQATELIGTPDVVIEVVSLSSIGKDTKRFMLQYHDAEIPEYWLVDVRDEVKFDIYRRTATKYVATKHQSGWVKSRVFGRSFRLSRHEKTKTLTTFTLDVQ